MNVEISWDERLKKALGMEMADADAQGWLFVRERDGFKPGASAWLRHADGTPSLLVTVCPCGCRSLGHTPVNKGPHAPGTWGWDGNELHPTCSPSIQKLTPCRWHGYLRNGVFEQV